MFGPRKCQHRPKLQGIGTVDSPFQTDREQSARVGNIAACVVKREVGEMFAIFRQRHAPRDSGL
jgi:hypothetical protein